MLTVEISFNCQNMWIKFSQFFYVIFIDISRDKVGSLRFQLSRYLVSFSYAWVYSVKMEPMFFLHFTPGIYIYLLIIIRVSLLFINVIYHSLLWICFFKQIKILGQEWYFDSLALIYIKGFRSHICSGNRNVMFRKFF